MSVMNIITQKYKCRMYKNHVQGWDVLCKLLAASWICPFECYRERRKSGTHFRLFCLVMATLTRWQLQTKLLLQYCQWGFLYFWLGFYVAFVGLWIGLWANSARHLLLKGQVWGRGSWWREELIQWEAFLKSLAHRPNRKTRIIAFLKERR